MTPQRWLFSVLSRPPVEYAGVELLERRQADFATRGGKIVWAHGGLALLLAAIGLALHRGGSPAPWWIALAAGHLYLALPLHAARLRGSIDQADRDRHGGDFEQLRLVPGLPEPLEPYWRLSAAIPTSRAFVVSAAAAAIAYSMWALSLAVAVYKALFAAPHKGEYVILFAAPLFALAAIAAWLTLAGAAWTLSALLCGSASGIARSAREMEAARQG